MNYIVVVAFHVNPADFTDVADNGPAVRELAQAMIKGDADFPDAIQMAVTPALPVLGGSDEWLLEELIQFAQRLQV